MGGVDFEGRRVVFLESCGYTGAPGSLSVGGVAEEGLGRCGEEVGVVVGEGYCLFVGLGR